jgi:hypothetical protein
MLLVQLPAAFKSDEDSLLLSSVLGLSLPAALSSWPGVAPQPRLASIGSQQQ